MMIHIYLKDKKDYKIEISMRQKLFEFITLCLR